MKRTIIFLVALVIAPVYAMAQGLGWQAAVSPRHYFSAASLNPTLVQAGYRILVNISVSNTTTTVYYLKFYDKATAPTCGTDTPVLVLAVPNQPTGTTSGQLDIHTNNGFAFSSGIGFCLTGAAADADTTNAATGVTINLGVK